MKNIFGDPQIFAVEIEIISFTPSLWGRTAIWLSGERIGIFDDNEDYLGIFIRAFTRLVIDRNKFWDEDLAEKDYRDQLKTIRPFFENPDDYYEKTLEELDKFDKYDKYLMSFGSGYDKWLINILIPGEDIIFLWFAYFNENNEPIQPDVNLVKCRRIKYRDFLIVYEQLIRFIPEEHMPNQLKGLVDQSMLLVAQWLS